MADSIQQPLPPPGGPVAMAGRPPAATRPRALLITLAIVLGSALLGIVAGLLWSAIAPQALFSVASRGVAYVVNPETSAFIAADGWFSLIAVVGGILIGLVAYLAGVRRYGPLPAAGALVGATAAAFLAEWAGTNVGLDGFRHRLAEARPGALLRQPAQLGAHGAMAFWPLAAGIVVGGIELIRAMRDRQRRLTAEQAGARTAAAMPAQPQQLGPAGPWPSGSGLDGRRYGVQPFHEPDAAAQQLDGQPLDGHSLDGQPLSGRPMDGRPVGGRPPGGQPLGGQALDGQRFDGQPPGGQPLDGQQPLDGRRLDGPG